MSEQYESASQNEKKLSPEQREALLQDAALEMGELATEITVKYPESAPVEAQEIILQGKAEYERQIENIIVTAAEETQQSTAYLSGNIEEVVTRANTVRRTLDDVEATLRTAVRYADEGHIDGVRSLLDEANGRLQPARTNLDGAASESGRLRGYAAKQSEEIQGFGLQMQKTDVGFEEFVEETKMQQSNPDMLETPRVNSSEAIAQLRHAADGLEDVSVALGRAERSGEEGAATILGAIRALDGLAYDAVSGRIQPDDIRRVVTKIQGVQEDIRPVGLLGSLNDQLGAVRQTVTRLAR